MNLYIENGKLDPFYNLALEQFVFDSLDRGAAYFMLWQNDNSIIVGKHQNTIAEINTSYVNAHNITVARRLSGGGAVYHDLGNINFTFISNAKNKSIDFAAFCLPVQKALVSFGVPAEITGRNDMSIEGKKFSGNAQYIKQDRVMHHGTLLYDSNLDVLSKALNVTEDKIESKGIKSVASRVTNIRPYMKVDLETREFFHMLKNHLFRDLQLKEYSLSAAEEAEVEKLRAQLYSQWSWNYGASPAHTIRKIRRIENCGKIEILLDVEKNGIIKTAAFYGDYFSANDPAELSAILKDCPLEKNELSSKLKDINISNYFHNLDKDTFISLLLE